MGMPNDYCELHAHSNFSFLDGASHPEELIARAAVLGMPALAVTDHAGLYGAGRLWKAASPKRPDEALARAARAGAGLTPLSGLASRGHLAGEKQFPIFARELVEEGLDEGRGHLI